VDEARDRRRSASSAGWLDFAKRRTRDLRELYTVAGTVSYILHQFARRSAKIRKWMRGSVSRFGSCGIRFEASTPSLSVPYIRKNREESKGVFFRRLLPRISHRLIKPSTIHFDRPSRAFKRHCCNPRIIRGFFPAKERARYLSENYNDRMKRREKDSGKPVDDGKSDLPTSCQTAIIIFQRDRTRNALTRVDETRFWKNGTQGIPLSFR